ncbi:hypothetical protein [Sphingomonas sp. IW22]|uniref:hypothetical protein n=1 Tax=Sphingomonas sp. IW22 TaxID=3242489 RepID=UPI0035208A13
MNSLQIRTIIFYEWKRGFSAQECLNNMKSSLGDDIVSQSTVYKFFRNFEDGNFSLEDETRHGRPKVIDDVVLLETIRGNPTIRTDELSKLFNTTSQTIRNYLHDLGYSSVWDKWVPHSLSEVDKEKRVNVCKELLHMHRKEDFFPRMVTADEKWVYYENLPRRRSWKKSDEEPVTVAKRGLTHKKVLMCIFWDIRGILYKEFLKSGQTLTTEVYIQQLHKVNSVIKKTWPSHLIRKGIIFLQDNAKPHTSNLTKQKLDKLRWTVLKHAPYSPDKAPSDYYLFRCLQNSLAGTKFKSSDETISQVQSFLSSKDQYFFKEGIYRLLKRWEKIVQNNGAYILD